MTDQQKDALAYQTMRRLARGAQGLAHELDQQTGDHGGGCGAAHAPTAIALLTASIVDIAKACATNPAGVFDTAIETLQEARAIAAHNVGKGREN